MLDELRKAPYYDDYDSSKQYTQLLAVPGRVAQAREITQIQSTVKDIIKNIGDSILKDGNIIEGCQVIPFEEEGRKRVRVTTGKVYIQGMVLTVTETVLDIVGEGTETIGVKLVEEIVTETQDPTLRDPAQSYANYNQPGCDRLKSYVIVVANDSDAATISTLIDGAISVEKYAPEYDTLTQTLARRTHDESGSYIVEGLNVRVEDNAENPSEFIVVVEAGKAYVMGYELRIPAPRRVKVLRSLEYNSVLGVRFTYDSSLDEYELSSLPYVKSITTVKGTMNKVVNQSIPDNTARVLIEETEGISIQYVKQGEEIYTVGTSSSGDCYLMREGGRYYLKWNGTSHYPTGTYEVSYNYTHTFKQDEDYALQDNSVLVWGGMLTPIEGTEFTVDYDQYLARKDTVYINPYGDIAVEIGTPAEYGFELVPEAPVNTLPLAYIMSPPAGDTTSSLRINVSNIGLTRFTMSDIQKILNRIRTLEYDQTILSLNDEAKQYKTSSDKRGIFTDPILDLSKIDIYYNLVDGSALDPSLPIYDAALDLSSNICYLPVITNIYDAIYSQDSSTSKSSRIATLKKNGEVFVLSQVNATKSFLVNPYSVFPQLPEISIDPAVDTWVEDSIINILVSRSSNSIISSSTRHVERYNYMGARRADDVETATQITTVGNRVSVSVNESVIGEKAITYIRTREINVVGSQFPANLDNIKCYFDGVETPLTPIGSTTSGTMSGSVRANNSGYFQAKFRIPSNILTGIREVRLESAHRVDGYESSAFALYQAAGTARTIQRTVTTLTTVLMNRVTTITTTHNVDPVGQTFVLDRMTILSGIDLYFEAKGNAPITCDIREVVNGNITSTVYGHKTLSTSEVLVSSDSKVATRFQFDDPVLLEANKEYAFVVRSTSPSYRIWVATLGERDIQTGESVLSNPYLIGVMMSSSNNSSWTTHQTTDVKFRLVADTYEESSVAIFESINSAEEFSRIYLLAESVIPSGCSIDWEYKLDSSTNYSKIAPYSLVNTNSMYNNITLRATLHRGSNNNLSPILALDSVGAILSCYDTSGGYYITNKIRGLDAYTTVEIILDTYLPSSGTSIEVFVSRSEDNESDILQRAELQSSRALNYNWKEQVYKVTVDESTSCRIFVKMSSDSAFHTPSFRRLRAIMS